MRILVTGGAGFVGSHLIRSLLLDKNHQVANLDALTYAANLQRLQAIATSPNYYFFHTNINDFARVSNILAEFKPEAIIHLAAETHVDNSIDNAAPFIHSNIVGTYSLLENVRLYWQKLKLNEQEKFRFLHISTDEVYGSLAFDAPKIAENSFYAPSSPYSASKASSDHLVWAWQKTHQIPTIITHCANNYGAFAHYEKLIPHMIYCALSGQNLPIYGNGRNVRDWLHVSDHIQALLTILQSGKTAQTYNISGEQEISNLDLVKKICALLEELAPNKPPQIQFYQDLITFIQDRKGHDLRYALNAAKIKNELGWSAQISLQEGLRQTVIWYLKNTNWLPKNAD